MIRMLLADDQALVRGALAALLDLEADLEVVAQVGRGDEVVDAARASAAEVCLLDIEMPGLTGLEAAGRLRTELPGVRSLIVTTFGRPGYVRRALDAGAAGFVVKDTPARELADAVRRVHAGLRVVDPDLATESLIDRPEAAHRPGARDADRSPSTGHRSPRSPRACTSPRAPSATTCPRRSARPAPSPAARRRGSRRSAAGCEPHWVSPTSGQRASRLACRRAPADRDDASFLTPPVVLRV